MGLNLTGWRHFWDLRGLNVAYLKECDQKLLEVMKPRRSPLAARRAMNCPP